MYRVYLAVAFACLFLLLRRFWLLRRYPRAAGNKFGVVTHLWYLWKTWDGKFEKWNIEQHALHGKVVRVSPNSYSIDDPEAVKIIYGVSSPLPKSQWYSAWGDPRVPNHNLFSATDNAFHAGMRRKVASLYSMTAIKSYEPYVDNCMKILFRRWDSIGRNGDTIDLQRWMQSYAFDVIGEISVCDTRRTFSGIYQHDNPSWCEQFSRRVGFLESDAQDVDGIIDKIDRANKFSMMLGNEFRLLPLLFAIYGNPALGIIAIKEKLSRAQQPSVDQEKTSDRVTEDFQTKLDTLREKNPEEFEAYHASIATVSNIAAGSDTTSISLTATLFHLIKTPGAFAKLRQEVQDAAQRGQIDDPITFDQAKSLPYLQMVMKEGLRIHPATGLPMWRIVPEPGMTIAGQFFPGGATVGINSWVAHNNSKVFGPDASQFRPERWDPAQTSPDQLKQMEQYYLPFGAGTHTCIGKNISILEMSKIVPELVRRYDFTLISPTMTHVNHWFVKPQDVQIRLRINDDQVKRELGRERMT